MRSKQSRWWARCAACVCAIVCLVLLGAWTYSTQRTVFLMTQFGDTLRLGGGVVMYLWTDANERRELSAGFGLPIEPQWRFHAGPRLFSMQWWDAPYSSTGMGRATVSIPLWIPILLSGVFAASLWRRGRAGPVPGRCAVCGYDLRGLGVGVSCPECGNR